jgi:hypothetical protein
MWVSISNYSLMMLNRLESPYTLSLQASEIAPDFDSSFNIEMSSPSSMPLGQTNQATFTNQNLGYSQGDLKKRL